MQQDAADRDAKRRQELEDENVKLLARIHELELEIERLK
jgi:hypothetical protein